MSVLSHMGKPCAVMPRRQTQREGTASPPLTEPLHNTGIAQPEGIGPSEKIVKPSGGPPLRDDMVLSVSDNGTRAETLLAHGNCHEDDGTSRHHTVGKTPMRERVGPSKGKGREPLDTRERWPREHLNTVQQWG